MKKIWPCIFLIAGLALGGCSLRGEETAETSALPDGSPKASASPASEPVIQNKALKPYVNEKHGFSLQIPVWSGVQVYEYGDIVYIGSDENPQKPEEQTKLLGKEADTIKVRGIPWAILIRDIADESELEKFIQERYGTSCKLGTNIATGTEDFSDVSILTGEPESDCFLNFIYAVKYDSRLKKVAIWDIGQDFRFRTKEGNPLDEEMRKSFKFVRE